MGARGLLLALALLAACAPADPPVTPASAQQVVRHLVEGLAVPRSGDFAASGARLERAVRKLCAAPSAAALDDARAAWRETARAWWALRPLLFGPARSIGLHRYASAWPAHEEVLAAALAGDVDPQVLADPHVRGIAAAEALLFGDEALPASLPAWSRPRRCAHLREVAAELARLGAALEAGWRDAYAAALLDAVPQQALGHFVAEALNAADEVMWKRLGLPAAFFRGDPAPRRLEAWRSGASLDGVTATLETLAASAAGAGEAALASVLHRVDAGAAAALATAARRTLDASQAIEPPLRTAVAERAKEVQSLYFAVQELQSRIRDAAHALALPIQLHADGD